MLSLPEPLGFVEFPVFPPVCFDVFFAFLKSFRGNILLQGFFVFQACVVAVRVAVAV
jgi:hypothetical protein